MPTRMPDEAQTRADAQTGAGTPTGADANTDASPGPPVQMGAGTPTGADANMDAHTGTPAGAVAVPLLDRHDRAKTTLLRLFRVLDLEVGS